MSRSWSTSGLIEHTSWSTSGVNIDLTYVIASHVLQGVSSITPLVLWPLDMTQVLTCPSLWISSTQFRLMCFSVWLIFSLYPYISLVSLCYIIIIVIRGSFVSLTLHTKRGKFMDLRWAYCNWILISINHCMLFICCFHYIVCHVWILFWWQIEEDFFISWMYNKKVIRFTLGYSSFSVIGLKIKLNRPPPFLLSNQCVDRVSSIEKSLGRGDYVNLAFFSENPFLFGT